MSHFIPQPPSHRSRATAVVTRLTIRPLGDVLPSNSLGLFAARQILAGSLAVFGRTARDTHVEPVDLRVDDGTRLRAEWVRVGETRTDAVILYLHGSGYIGCSPKTHRGLTSQLSLLTGLPVFSLDYRLAPRHRFPAAADDVRRAFDWLVAQGHRADRIVVAGDSAGGHLAIDLALELSRADQARPAAILLMSPLVDPTFTLSAERECISPDPMTRASHGRWLVDHYTAGELPDHPRLQHVVASHEALPPTLIQAGGAEMLASDAHHLHRALLASGTSCRLEVWPGQMHVFQAIPRLVPESSAALRRAATFLVDNVPAVHAVPDAVTPGSAPRRPATRRTA